MSIADVIDPFIRVIGETTSAVEIMKLFWNENGETTVKVLMSAVDEFGVENFSQLAPQTPIELSVVGKTVHKKISIKNNAIDEYQMVNIYPTIDRRETLTLNFVANNSEESAREYFLNLKNENLKRNIETLICIQNKLLSDQDLTSQKVCVQNKLFGDMATSIGNIVTFSNNEDFRSKCFSLLRQDSTDASINELIEKALKNTFQAHDDQNK